MIQSLRKCGRTGRPLPNATRMTWRQCARLFEVKMCKVAVQSSAGPLGGYLRALQASARTGGCASPPRWRRFCLRMRPDTCHPHEVASDTCLADPSHSDCLCVSRFCAPAAGTGARTDSNRFAHRVPRVDCHWSYTFGAPWRATPNLAPQAFVA